MNGFKSRGKYARTSGTLSAEKTDDDNKTPFSEHLADVAKGTIATGLGVGAVTLIDNLVSDGASGMFGGVSAGGGFGS